MVRIDRHTFMTQCAYPVGPEHSTGSGRPSYCTLPIFHPPRNLEDPVDGHCYISNDGHLFKCNPVVTQHAFHVYARPCLATEDANALNFYRIFVIDRLGVSVVERSISYSPSRSSSMCSTDRRPLANGPAADLIRCRADNRLGAVYSALYSFWSAAGSTMADQQRISPRRDAYSVVLFNNSTKIALVNDFTSSPDQLLESLLSEEGGGGTNFSLALRAAKSVMLENWSTERLVT